MPSLLDRLREVLAPRYDVERQLGAGGMGVVFLARDRHLDRAVAIKVLRPELATAFAAERFVREARLMARLSHPNIVTVHDAGEAGGLSYYAMDYVAGETLQARLRQGPLAAVQAVKLGRDLLDALEAAHRHSVIHRDIKPGNIFLVRGRALLADFGVALATTDDALSLPGAVIGTPGWMPPEQSARGEVTPRTDVYAVGMVLYQALTGRHWELPADERNADWSGVPRALIPVLKRALAWLPERRWPDARSFRRAWWKTRSTPYVWRTVGLSILGAVLGVAVGKLAESPRRTLLGSRGAILIEPFAVLDERLPRGLGASLAHSLASALQGSPDFAVAVPQSAGSDATIRLTGSVRSRNGTVCVELLARNGAEVPAEVCAPAEQPEALVRELAGRVLRVIWTSEALQDLPRRALPRDPKGFDTWLRAEHLFAQARWAEASAAYAAAERLDSTCWLCSWRLEEVGRWLGPVQDPDRRFRYLSHLDSFPPHYRTLMRAGAVPLAARLDTLEVATQRHPRFFLAWVLLGDELFHRGPLAGRARREALEKLAQAADLAPDFAPAWEHLAWARIAEGDSAGASAALQRWLAAMGGAPIDVFAAELRALMEIGFASRFGDPATAAPLLDQALAVPEIAGSPDLGAAPRLLPTFDAPAGAVWLGRRWTELRERPQVVRSGLLAQAFGHLALGQPQLARSRLSELITRFPDEELLLFAAELQGAVLLVDSVAVPGWRPDVERALKRYSAAGAPRESGRVRSGWMSAMLAPAASNEAAALTPAPSARTLSTLVDAVRQGRRGDWRGAVARSDAAAADTAAQLADPVLGGVVRLLRADWLARAGNPAAVRRTLRWAEHYDVRGYPSGPPQAAEVDWALRTLARWRLATTLDAAGEQDEEVCRAYARVARSWAAGEPVYRARADSARSRAHALGCADQQ